MEEFEIVPTEELKQMFIDIDAPREIQMYFIALNNNYAKLKLEYDKLTAIA